RVEVSGTEGAIAFDLEDLNTLEFYDRTAPDDRQGFTRILVTEPSHPYVSAWWPAGHMLGYEHGFSHQVVDFVTAIAERHQPTPPFADGLHVQRVLDAVERSAVAQSVWTTVWQQTDPSRRTPCLVRSRSSPASGPTCRSRRWRASHPGGGTTVSSSPAGETISTRGAGTSPATSRANSSCLSAMA